MAFCHIYARGDGTFTVRMRGINSVSQFPGAAEFASRPFEGEADARRWIRDGRQFAGLEDMPEPKVVRRGKAEREGGQA